LKRDGSRFGNGVLFMKAVWPQVGAFKGLYPSVVPVDEGKERGWRRGNVMGSLGYLGMGENQLSCAWEGGEPKVIFPSLAKHN
jgi:hypothetical protein